MSKGLARARSFQPSRFLRRINSTPSRYISRSKSITTIPTPKSKRFDKKSELSILQDIMKVSDDSNDEKVPRDLKHVLSKASNIPQVSSPPPSADCLLATAMLLVGGGDGADVEASMKAAANSMLLPVWEEAGEECYSGARCFEHITTGGVRVSALASEPAVGRSSPTRGGLLSKELVQEKHDSQSIEKGLTAAKSPKSNAISFS